MCLGALKEERGTKIVPLSYVSPLPSPVIEKQRSCVAELLQKDVMTACGPWARGGETTSHRPRETDDTGGD